MSSKRWLAPWKDSFEKPAIYHCISRVVDRRFVFGDLEREKFRVFMRMQENFSGCRVLAYCVMSNHFHILLEVPPMPCLPEQSNLPNHPKQSSVGSDAGPGSGSGSPATPTPPRRGISDAVLLERLRAIYSDAQVAEIAQQLVDARAEGHEHRVEEIHARYTYRMHDLGEFMKTLLQRFTRWFNRTHDRSGTLWEERYKSVIVESGVAARTIAAYIDLNPVRAGMVEDPSEYRWSSYGEAVGGGPRGNGKKARAGLVRACTSARGGGFDAEKWKEVSRSYRRLLGMTLGRGEGKAGAGAGAGVETESILADAGMLGMLRQRVRYFTDGAVIGSREFVNEAFAAARERFGEKRCDGARRMRGNGKAAAGVLWSLRDLRLRV